MRHVSEGWRTRASRARTIGEPLPAHPGRAAAPAPAYVAMPRLPAAAAVAARLPWKGVALSLPLVGLLVYLWSSTTYSVPLGEPAMIVALVGLLLQRERLRVPGFLAIFVAFLAWAAVGYAVSDYPAVVTAQLDSLARVGLIALVLVNALRSRAEQRLFMFVFLGAFALYPVRGALVNYVGGYTVFGRALWNYIYANPNDLAALTLLQLGLALAYLVREPKGWPRLAAIAGVFLLPLVILLTQSRGTIIALAVCALIAIAGQKRRMRSLVIFGAVAIVSATFAPESVWERLRGLRGVTDTSNLGKVDSSAEQRYEIWRVARTVFADNKLFGTGIGTYKLAHRAYTRGSRFEPIARGSRDAHSTYLTLLAEVGVVGFALFVAMFAGTMLWAERVRRRAKHYLPQSAQQIFYLELGLLGFFLAGIFASYAGLAFAYIHLGLLWSVADATDGELRAGPAPTPYGRAAAA